MISSTSNFLNLTGSFWGWLPKTKMTIKPNSLWRCAVSYLKKTPCFFSLIPMLLVFSGLPKTLNLQNGEDWLINLTCVSQPCVLTSFGKFSKAITVHHLVPMDGAISTWQGGSCLKFYANMIIQNRYPPKNKHIPLPASTLRMIFFFPRWDMYPFPGGYLLFLGGSVFTIRDNRSGFVVACNC